MVKPKHKQPAFGAVVKDLKNKKARLGADPGEAERSRPVWQVGSMDWDGPFGCGALTDSGAIRDLWAHLRDFESMSWVEIEQAGSHNVEVEKLSAEARERLVELRLDDIDELFSLRITGRRRVWGFRETNVLRLLWWDPEHQVCPSERD